MKLEGKSNTLFCFNLTWPYIHSNMHWCDFFAPVSESFLGSLLAQVLLPVLLLLVSKLSIQRLTNLDTVTIMSSSKLRDTRTCHLLSCNRIWIVHSLPGRLYAALCRSHPTRPESGKQKNINKGRIFNADHCLYLLEEYLFSSVCSLASRLNQFKFNCYKCSVQ